MAPSAAAPWSTRCSAGRGRSSWGARSHSQCELACLLSCAQSSFFSPAVSELRFAHHLFRWEWSPSGWLRRDHLHQFERTDYHSGNWPRPCLPPRSWVTPYLRRTRSWEPGTCRRFGRAGTSPGRWFCRGTDIPTVPPTKRTSNTSPPSFQIGHNSIIQWDPAHPNFLSSWHPWLRLWPRGAPSGRRPRYQGSPLSSFWGDRRRRRPRSG